MSASSRTSRARAALYAAFRISANSEGWALWEDLRNAFREVYPIKPRRNPTPVRHRESQKRALTRALSSLADRIEVQISDNGRRFRLRRAEPP